MDKEFIKDLIKLTQASSIKRLELRLEGLELILETYEKTQVKQIQTPEEIPEKEEKPYYVVKSPLVGTFYRSPSPGAPPFVEVGDNVAKGQVLCIIEALKVMNEIESEVSGRIVKILVENGETVEYNQPLFLIDENP
ncbi:MAG: acetyl-CoA carboxylase biotin carboxyl carrier protein [Aquificaceae bacterium]|nr:acetyl-CoA carboxylase biotin carboxyl carrier protein [Aquificaceae bacterium]MDW8237811.1 acetyl-CoA carboxylase biotin carboxyl carrier protein [Aquificaceae bacterium]